MLPLAQMTPQWCEQKLLVVAQCLWMMKSTGIYWKVLHYLCFTTPELPKLQLKFFHCHGSPRSLAAHHGLSLQDNTSKQAALPPIPRDSSPAPGYASANVVSIIHVNIH